MRKAVQEFSRFAESYGRHNLIQTEVAKRLVSLLPEKRYGSILDLGCGSGALYRHLKDRQIVYEHMTAMDISAEMLRLHPRESRLALVEGNFGTNDFIPRLPRRRYDLLLSSSALQWSADLERTFSLLPLLSERHYLAIFTAGTFRSLHDYLGIASPIRTEESVREIAGRYLDLTFETVRYTLEFDTVYGMLRYIKESGVSGGERRISYREARELLNRYEGRHLEFEVLFAYSKS